MEVRSLGMPELVQEVTRNVGEVMEQKLSKLTDTLDKIASSLKSEGLLCSTTEWSADTRMQKKLGTFWTSWSDHNYQWDIQINRWYVENLFQAPPQIWFYCIFSLGIFLLLLLWTFSNLAIIWAVQKIRHSPCSWWINQSLLSLFFSFWL